MGQKIHYDKHCRLEFGTYVQVHEKHNNSMESRTSGAIALCPSGSEQGRHYFLSLHTGKRILRNHWTVLPITNDMVDAVHRLAATSKQTGGITFTDKEGNIIMEDDESDADDGPEDLPIPVDDDMDDIHVEGIDTSIETTGVGSQVHDIGNTEAETRNMETTGVDDGMTGTHVGTEENVQVSEIHIGTENVQELSTSTQNEENNHNDYVTIGDIDITSEMNTSNRQYEAEEEEAEGRKNTRYNLRPKPRNTQ